MFNSIRDIVIAREHYEDLRREADAYRRLHTDAPARRGTFSRILAGLSARRTGAAESNA